MVMMRACGDEYEVLQESLYVKLPAWAQRSIGHGSGFQHEIGYVSARD